MTFPITNAGPHTFGLGVREDGAFFDKFAIATDTNFNPTAYGPFGPPETSAGVPPLPALAITSPTTNDQFNAGATIPITVQISQSTRLIVKVEFFSGVNKIGEATNSPYYLTWPGAPAGTKILTASLTDDLNDMVSSLPVTVIVNPAQGVSLTAGADAAGLTLTWTGGTAPYTVQRKASLSDPAWVDVVTTDLTTTVVPISGPSGFFRISTPLP